MSPRAWRRVFRLDTGRRHVERDVNEEIAFHIEMRTRKLVAAGMDPDAARAAAVAQFGDLPGVRDECLTIGRERERALRLSDIWHGVQQDVVYAARTFARQPGFTLVVLVILALGIGANTATFALIDALMLRALPVAHAAQLVTIGDPAATGDMSSGTPSTDYVSYPVFADVQQQTKTLTGVYATGSTGTIDVRPLDTRGNDLDVDAPAEHPRARYVSGSFFNVLGVRAAFGRTFTIAADRAVGADPVIVISDAYWHRRFDGDRAVIGRQVSMNGVRVTIVGVTPPGFTGDIVGFTADLWIPLTMQPVIAPYRKWFDDRSVSWLLMMGRLAPGVTAAQAQSEISAIELHSILDHASPDNRKNVQENVREKPIRVEPGARGFSYYRSAYAQALVILMAAVVLVMLVVCANVANLMLAKAATRAREISVRMALGAGRGRLVQQLLTESLALAMVAGALGLLVANWAIRLLLTIGSQGPTPIPLDVRLDARMLAYTAAASFATMIIFGLAPALRATRLDLTSALRGQGRAHGALGGPGRFGMGRWLVATQVALSTILLVGAGMLVHSAAHMATIDLGMDRDHIAVVTLGAGKAGYAGRRLETLMNDIASRERAVPGVRGSSYSSNGLFSGTESGAGIRIPGYEVRADSDNDVVFDGVGPGYFDAVGARIERGRGIEAGDRADAPRVVVLNETAARYYFGHANPLGRTLTRSDTSYTIVGVAADVEEQSVRASPVRRVYFPIPQLLRPLSDVYLEVRVAGNPADYVKPIRDAVLAADRHLNPQVQTVNAQVRQGTGQDWLVTQIVAVFGVLTLVVAALGLYGLMAYATARRTGEFGVRVALGAAPGSVTRMILGEALGLTGVGVAIGIPAGLLAARLIRGQLFGVGAIDVPSLVVAIGVLAAAAALAAYLPARRAARVGPLEALRAD